MHLDVVSKKGDHLLAKELVIQAFKLLGLRSATTANCKILSREMERTIGKKLSAITLFRMLFPDKYGVTPYSYSLDILYEFIEKSKSKSHDHRHHLSSSQELSENALYKLLSRNLYSAENDLVVGFFEDLPMHHLALGGERHIIGKSFGDWFRTCSDTNSYNKKKILLGIPQIRTYYFETYLDYNHGFAVYGRGMERMLRRHGADDVSSLKRSIDSADAAWLISLLFSYLMLYHFAYLSVDEERRLRYRNILRDPVVEEILPLVLLEAPFVYFRYIAFTCMEETENVSPITKYHLEEWVDLLNRSFEQKRPWEMEFASVILCDLLVVLKEQHLLEHLLRDFPPKPIYEEIAQPVYIRAMLYRALCSGENDEKVMDIAKMPYALGDGETAYHQLLMDRVMVLFDRQYLSHQEKNALISQTGFLRFQDETS
jgi:hypothetical protein